MSSTNRGYDRYKADYYVTPVNKILEFLNEFIKHEPNAFNGEILDPTAGGDNKHPMSYPKALKLFGVKSPITTIDIREDSLAEIKTDYLTYKLEFQPKTIITNPPFNIAENVILKALDDVQDNGFVIMLLRLNFFEGKKRLEEFYSKVGLPKYSFVHHRRMSFTDDGRADSIAYQHAVWQKGYKPEFTALKII